MGLQAAMASLYPPKYPSIRRHCHEALACGHSLSVRVFSLCCFYSLRSLVCMRVDIVVIQCHAYVEVVCSRAS